MRISDWSSDVCSSDLKQFLASSDKFDQLAQLQREVVQRRGQYEKLAERTTQLRLESNTTDAGIQPIGEAVASHDPAGLAIPVMLVMGAAFGAVVGLVRSAEHTSELQSLMRTSYAVFCLKKKKHRHTRR